MVHQKIVSFDTVFSIIIPPYNLHYKEGTTKGGRLLTAYTASGLPTGTVFLSLHFTEQQTLRISQCLL